MQRKWSVAQGFSWFWVSLKLVITLGAVRLPGTGLHLDEPPLRRVPHQPRAAQGGPRPR